MNEQELKNQFEKITLWERGGQRAPHKPLLILFALSQCLRKNERFTSYAEIDEKLKELLIEFGPTRKSYHPEYPFWRLQNDGIWELNNAENVTARIGNTDAKKSELAKYNVHGGFKKKIYDFLKSKQSIIPALAASVLEENFPSSMHEDLLQAIGLDVGLNQDLKRKRDPYFRDKILKAYEYQCAVCGFNVRVGHSLVALEAAHIKWHQAGGPDTEKNGVALCVLHHKLFDRGAFSLTKEMKIEVSDRAYGTQGFAEWLMAFHGKKIKRPQHPYYFPEPQFIKWHLSEVFQGYGRYNETKTI